VTATTAVGSHDANAFGLYDVYGNVAEWTQDCYAATYASAPVDGGALAPDHCTRRVYRGGAYSDQAAALRSAARKSGSPSVRLPALGFRVVRELH
jgi:serine/threonine-protein kinase PpkA